MSKVEDFPIHFPSLIFEKKDMVLCVASAGSVDGGGLLSSGREICKFNFDEDD